MKQELEGVAHLPAQLLVTPDALGQTFDARTGPTNFSISFPVLPKDAEDEGFFLEPPYATTRWARLKNLEGKWGQMGFDKVPGLPRPLESNVGVVALRIHGENLADISLASFAASFGSSYDAWYATVVEWFELWGYRQWANSFSPPALSSGSLWPVDLKDSRLSGWHPPLYAHFSGSGNAVNANTISSAFDHASGNEHPPPEWLLYLNALRSHDPRQAIIEANTAAEVGMAHAIHDRFPARSEGAREQIVKQANGVVGLAELLSAIDGSAGSAPSIGKIKHQLAGPRNRAAHRGAAPTQDEVDQARNVAKSLLDAYSPLPGA